MKFTKNTRVYITGCAGMLGDAFYKILKGKVTLKATDIDLNTKWLSYADVRDYNTMEKDIAKFKPDIVFHLAALTDLEYCELHPKETWDTNALGTDNIALICKKRNIPMVYICTAGIFDGKKEEYVDFDIPNPGNYYGSAKYAGELAVKELVPNHFVFRAGWMMGGGPKKDKKFVNIIMQLIKSGAKDIYAVDDKFGTPTYTFDFVKNMLHVIEQDAYGTYNSVCTGSCNRYDVSEEILRILGKKNIKLHKVHSDYFGKKYFAFRPPSEKLIPFKLQERNLYIMRDWKTCLKEYLSKWDTYSYE